MKCDRSGLVNFKSLSFGTSYFRCIGWLLFWLGFLPATKAQNWGGGIDDEPFNWGYTFQYISAEYKVWKNPDWRNPYPNPTYAIPFDTRPYLTDSLSAVWSKPTPGFAIGFVVNKKITSFLDFRITPLLAFSDRKMIYDYQADSKGKPATRIEKVTKSTVLDFPVSLKLKSERIMNYRAYMLTGIKYSIDVASNKDNESITNELEKHLKNRKNYFSYEAGIGFDIYLEYFKMSPEFKLSYSFKNMLAKDQNAFSNPLDRAKLRHFTFSLFFE